MERIHSDREYENELHQLRDQISQMGTGVAEMIGKSTRALVERNSAVAHRLIEFDREINRYEVDTDDLCMRILARRQPVASDLRFITTGLKLVTDLERVGDLCVNICERVIELSTEAAPETYGNLTEMADMAERMVREAINAFMNRDPDRAREVIAMDRTVDAYFAQMFRELLTSMMDDPKNVYQATRFQSISRNLERIGDHATNLAEMVIFMVQGQDIRHPGQIEGPEHAYTPHGVLFLCVRNAARSQMAEGWARRLLPLGVRIWSAGSDPAPAVNPHAVRVMREVGIDISRQYPKRISDVALGDVDTVVTLCSEEICVTLPSEIRHATWVYADPTRVKGSEEDVLEAFRQIRDDLKTRVAELANRPIEASR